MRGVPLDEEAVLMHNILFPEEDRKAVVSKALDWLYERMRQKRDVHAFVMPGGEVCICESQGK
jgi:hypothetical protein